MAIDGRFAGWLYDREGGSTSYHSADEEEVHVLSEPSMAQVQKNRRLARRKAHFELFQLNLVFRMPRASLLARASS